jgi:hypothetical protein
VMRLKRQGADRLSATTSRIPFEPPARSVRMHTDLNLSLGADQMSASVRSQSDLNYAPRTVSNYRPRQDTLRTDPLQRTVPTFTDTKRAHVMPVRGSVWNSRANVTQSGGHRRVFVAPPRTRY